MPILYLNEDRTLVRRDGEDCLLVQIPEQRDKEGNVIAGRKERVGLAKLEGVVVLGEVTLTASALTLLLEHNLEVNFLSYFGHFKGRLSPPLSKNSLLRLAQHQAHHQLEKRAELARRFVIGKVVNQRTLLLRYNRRLEDSELTSAVESQQATLRKLANLTLSTNVPSAQPLATGDTRIEGSSVETIMGLEGAASAAYFRCFGRLIADPSQWLFQGRVRRPPTDPVNALLSFGYALLTNQVASAVQTVGFDPFIGYLHSSTYGRPALALDLMEEFRPVIVDSVVLTLLNNRMLAPDDFLKELDAYRLKAVPRKLFLTKFEERLNEEVQHPVFGYKVKYRRCIELQARLVAKYLTGEIETISTFYGTVNSMAYKSTNQGTTTCYVIAYDISDNSRRTKIHKILCGFGKWTQYSLFECFLTKKDLVVLRSKLVKHLKEGQDSVRLYPLCASCVEKVDTMGGRPPTEDTVFIL